VKLSLISILNHPFLGEKFAPLGAAGGGILVLGGGGALEP
jgi:hypothetical protein